MRHRIGYRKLNRTSEHRKALFKNMLNSLIKYEQITTTLPKAKELKPQIDKVITLGKKNNLQSKKNLFSELQSKKVDVKKKVETTTKDQQESKAKETEKRLNLKNKLFMIDILSCFNYSCVTT